MRQLVFFIRNRVAVFLLQLGIQERHRAIRTGWVTVTVRGVMSERPKRKRVAVKVLGVAEKSQDKVSAPQIVNTARFTNPSPAVGGNTSPNRGSSGSACSVRINQNRMSYCRSVTTHVIVERESYLVASTATLLPFP
jgi:hypothetical protein